MNERTLSRERARYVHLGDRLLAVGRIREGMLTAEDAARGLGVSVDEVIGWQQVHAFERTVSFDELRRGGSPEAQRLSRRAQRLADLVADAERELRALHQELLHGVMASNEPFVEIARPPRKSHEKHMPARSASRLRNPGELERANSLTPNPRAD